MTALIITAVVCIAIGVLIAVPQGPTQGQKENKFKEPKNS
jgi:hypothetical protein